MALVALPVLQRQQGFVRTLRRETEKNLRSSNAERVSGRARTSQTARTPE
jgi:hypothetical protein